MCFIVTFCRYVLVSLVLVYFCGSSFQTGHNDKLCIIASFGSKHYMCKWLVYIISLHKMQLWNYPFFIFLIPLLTGLLKLLLKISMRQYLSSEFWISQISSVVGLASRSKIGLDNFFLGSYYNAQQKYESTLLHTSVIH